MTLEELCARYHVACNADVPLVVGLANRDVNSIFVRDMHKDRFYPLGEYAQGPFHCVREAFHHVMVGYNKETGVPTKLRVADVTVQLFNTKQGRWVSPSTGDMQLYMPNS